MPIIATRIKNAPPHVATRLTVPQHHLESLRAALVAQLRTHVGYKVCEERDPRTDFETLLNDRNNLPALILRFRDLQAGQPDVPVQPYLTERIANTWLFAPKHAGTSVASDDGYLQDNGSSFESFLKKVRPGDPVGVVEDQGETVDVLQATSVVAVDFPNKRVQVAHDLFSDGGIPYEIHWPYNVKRTYVTTRYVTMQLDLYAHPDAVDGEPGSLVYIERLTRGWFESQLAQITFQLNGTSLRRELGFRVHDLSDPLGETVGSFLRRAVIEIPLMVGELVEHPWPTVESVGISGEVMVRWSDTNPLIAFKEETTQDDTRTTQFGG